MTDLAAQVREFLPLARGRELELRIALMKARDYAASLCGQADSERAHGYAWDAHELAGEFLYAPAPLARLEIIVKHCRFLVMNAFLADHLDGERVHQGTKGGA